jgi:SAM-dependent MidA family methyltransferase
MADMLRAIKTNWPDFFATLDVHLVEINPVLKQQQQEMLADYTVTWHEKLSDVPEGFTFFIGNEFLDALPIHQYERQDGQWFERCVTVDENDNLVFGLKETLFTDPEIKQDGIREVSPAVVTAVAEVSDRLVRHGGVAVLIDYGYTQENAIGDTFQAVSRHEFVSPLLHPGQVDLTAHIDFLAAAQAAETTGAVVQGILTQRDFLCGLGIEQRAAQLSATGGAEQAKDIQAALHRLIAPDEMGDLFKVMVVTQ